MIQLSLITIPILVLVLGSGLLADEVAFAQQRFFSADSEESALSRLPVVYASVRMFEEKPLFGWGYENFDKFDYRFQRRVGDLITPDKDHASHNVYLTILAEQGLAGLALFLAPMMWVLFATARAWPRMRAEGFYSRKLVFSLWLVIVFHVVVNNFSNMRIEYGQGMWWIALALIATLAGDESMTARGQDA
jgi:O-antigen ligase